MSILGFYYKQKAKQLAKPRGIFGRRVAKQLNAVHQLEYDFITQEIKIYSSASVLEVGFANGALLSRLANCYDNQYYGIDISKDMVKTASLINKNFINNGNMKLCEADIEKTPFDNESFDVIYTANTVYFWRNVEKAVNEIKRVLKPGGKFINLALTKEGFEKFPEAAYHGFIVYTLTELCDMLKGIGANVEHRNIDRENSFAIIVTKDRRILK